MVVFYSFSESLIVILNGSYCTVIMTAKKQIIKILVIKPTVLGTIVPFSSDFKQKFQYKLIFIQNKFTIFILLCFYLVEIY